MLSVSLQLGSGFWTGIFCRSSAETVRSEVFVALGTVADPACGFVPDSFEVSSATFFDSATGSDSGRADEFLSAESSALASGLVVGSDVEELSADLSDGVTVEALVLPPLNVSPN